MISRFLHLTTSLAVCGLLAACGGSSSKEMEAPNTPTEMEEPSPPEMEEPNPPTDPFISAARGLTGVEVPAETPEAHAQGVTAHLAALREKASNGEVVLLSSNVFGDSNGEDTTVVYICSADVCTNPDDGDDYFSLEDILDTLAAYEGPLPVLTRRDLTTSVYGGNNKVYGAWMEHGVFFVDATPGTAALTERFAAAMGASTGGAPAAGGTWAGLMVGTPQRGDNKGDILQGDATLVYTADDGQRGGGSLDVSFTDIRNIDDTSHEVSDIQFDDIPVRGSGGSGQYAYDLSNDDNGNQKIEDGERRSIQGDFMGPDHAETAGTFEYNGIVGAFGASKQPDSE